MRDRIFCGRLVRHPVPRQTGTTRIHPPLYAHLPAH